MRKGSLLLLLVLVFLPGAAHAGGDSSSLNPSGCIAAPTSDLVMIGLLAAGLVIGLLIGGAAGYALGLQRSNEEHRTLNKLMG